MLKTLIKLLYPHEVSCHVCNAEIDNGTLCDTCNNDLIAIQGSVCSKCGKPLDNLQLYEFYGYKCKQCQEQYTYFNKHRSFALYEGTMKTILLQLKYKGKVHHSQFLSERLSEVVLNDIDLRSVDYIIPVPIHYTRKLFRGYNQSALIAEDMSKLLQHSIYLEGLKRGKITRKLKKLDKESRKQELKDAIVINEKYRYQLIGKKVLLIDDIYTTGTTLNACSKALYACGCESINCVTVAMGH